MTAFNIDCTTDQPDLIYVEIDRRFNVAIERMESGLSIRIYPRTGGELWDDPFTTFEVDEDEILELEKELEPSDAYFCGASGKRYTFGEIADRIRSEAAHTLGKHISVQLEALGLLEEMQNGTTPCGLPFTFADEPHPIEKQLTSTSMFHTPGVFRALQHDYRIPGDRRRRAVRVLREAFGLPPAEADGLLSGAIASTIDETAGTITYSIVNNR